MNKQVIDLGFILKQIQDSDFSMNTFQDRLKFQKMIYLLQAFNVYLGYDFSWYLRGPYCPVLTTNGFTLQEIYNEIPDEQTKFRDPSVQKRFEKFQKFVKDKGTDELEIAASIHCLKHIAVLSDDEIKTKVENKQSQFTSEQVTKIWNEMVKWELL